MTTQELQEDENDLMECSNCGCSEWRVYITIIIDDARLYCSNCNQEI